MSQNNQDEFPINVGPESKTDRKTAQHLPSFFRTDANKKFLGGTLDPLTQPGKLTRINSYIGRRDIPNYNFSDNYIDEDTNTRQYYQLEPSFVYDDAVTGKVKWYADYIDYMNSLKYFGAPVGNHSKLNKSEAYSWDPHIDWDKFVNYREYYWLPNGPDPITIYGENESIVSTYSVTSRLDNDNSVYIFSPDGLTANPMLTLYKGVTYKFEINSRGNPFCIKTRPETGTGFFYNVGVTKQLVENGEMIFTVPYEAPSVLYYLNNNDLNSIGVIETKDIRDATHLDVDLTISGKKTFTSSNGVEFINGLKIKFAGKVFPEKYATGFWYVEGVGSKIKLISSDDITTPVTYGETFETPFEVQPFDSIPWEIATSYSTTKDYIVINRASRDRNPWARNNRWFHINVINATSKANNQVSLFDQKQRAIRPIIEFAPNIKLFNNGWISKKDVDLVDTVTTDVFSTIEGSLEFWIDEEKIYPGYRILFTADTDPLVSGRIYRVVNVFNSIRNESQISLQLVDDSEPMDGEVVYATKGFNKGNSFYYQNNIWTKAQKKDKVNQSPLFDLFDESSSSYSNKTTYPFNTFLGNKIFSYKEGTGSTDNELGFSLSYRAIDNVGDIEFSFDLQKQSWTYQSNNTLNLVNSYAGFLRKLNNDDTFSYTNGWVSTYSKLEQPAVRVLKIDSETDLIPIDVYDNSADFSGLSVRVYVNNKKADPSTFVFENIQGYYYIKFNTPLSVNDKIVYKVKSSASKNTKGYYEIPANWQNNPLNESVDSFTFGEVIDHVGSIVDNVLPFSGNYPGISNLANLGTVSQYGQRFLQHAGSMPLSAFVLTDKHANVIKALRYTAKKYTAFKKEFMRLATITPITGTPAEIVDQILADYSAAKYLDLSAFYYSDMAAAGASSVRNYTVTDPRLPLFVIDSIFTPMTSSKRQVLVYLNDVQMIYGIDYNFETLDAFVKILSPLNVGDRVTIKDYANTDGRSYIPYTPSKLGLYPSYVPRIFIDDTFITPTKVIEGHDGSITVAYDDYRDEVLLELERRIFNSRKVEYDTSIFNLDEVLCGYYRKTNFSNLEINSLLLGDFLKWNSIADLDVTSNDYYVEENSFTYNYNSSLAPNGTENLNGYWRGVYKYFYDTDRPHTNPWEMLGITIKPVWWDDVYGEAPYTSENKILWNHIERGLISDPNFSRINIRYIRTGLSKYLPVDADGNLLSPLDNNLAQNFSLVNAKKDYVFGDQAPVETAWRRSSEYPYSIISAICVLRGAEFIGKMWDRFTIKRNIAGQIYSTVNGAKLQPSNITFPNVPLGNPNDPTVQISVTSGLVNFIEEYLFDAKYTSTDLYKETIKSLDAKLSYRMAGFTSKEQINVLLDSRSPNATGTVFLPTENYKIFYNNSSPVSTVSYSGVIVEKVGTSYPLWISGNRYHSGDRATFQGEIYHCVSTHVSNSDRLLTSVEKFERDSKNWIKETIQKIGYKVRGYDLEKNYFEVFGYRSSYNDPALNVGGISESYVNWEESKYYTKGQIIRYENTGYLRSLIGHTSSKSFDSDADKWVKLAKLPIVGGISVSRRTRFGTDPIKINYGTIFASAQEVVDFLLGYEKRLEYYGFSFDDFSKDLNVPLTWLTSAKEFMFWTLQNWAAGSVITLSPAANKIKFVPQIKAAVDNTDTDFYDYSIFKADGSPLKADLTDVYREGPGFIIKPALETNDGIFHIRANLVYKEHVLLFDNVSIFNDVLYDKVPGYRQGRLKIIGYKTSRWDGSYNSPGFMYDQAEVNDWVSNKDYMIGDIVKFKSYYFTSLTRILGKEDFDYNDWKQLTSAPVSGLIPNFDYRIEQFRDFYSLDSSGFDSTQEALARHLIGYQPRQYLANIINDEVSQYKFYQGFIKEKGTFNSISKLFDVLRASGFSSIDIKEEWAFKIGEYGASDAYTEFEFSLDETKLLHNPQNINFTQTEKYFSDSSIYNICANEISIKPSNYNSNPFKKIKIDPDQNNYGVFKYQVAGYVKEDDVDHIVINESALLNYDTSLFSEKDKIWLGYTSDNDWDVYEYINTNITILGWTVSDNLISLSCNVIPDVNVDDIVVISNLDTIDGSYKVQSVYNNIIEIYTFNSTIFTIQDNITSGVIHLLKSSRYASLGAVSTNRYNTKDIRGEIIWVDKDKNDKWLVLENQDSFTKFEVVVRNPNISNQEYGSNVKVSGNNRWMFVSATKNEFGKVYVFSRLTDTASWTFFQIIELPLQFINNYQSSPTAKFGISLDVTTDGSTLVIGSTDVNYVNMTFARGCNQVAELGEPTNFTNQGMVVIYTYDSRLKYQIETGIASYAPATNERFGSSVKITNDGTNIWLFVSSENYNTDRGRVQIFRKTDGFWRANSLTNSALNYLNSGVTFNAKDKYGYSLDCSSDASLVAVSAPFRGAGAVYVFKRTGYQYDLIKDINSSTLDTGDVSGDVLLQDTDAFGYSVSINSDLLVVSCPNDDTKGNNVGSVYIFNTTDYKLEQFILPPIVTTNDQFGTKLSISPSSNVLAISARGSSSLIPLTFDNYADRVSSSSYELDSTSIKIDGTTFDNNSLAFYDIRPYSGAVYVYNRFDNHFIYGDRLRPINDLESDDNFGASVSVNNATVIVGTPNRKVGTILCGTVFTFDYSDRSWKIKESQDSLVDISKFKKAFIYNTKTNSLIEPLDFYDPAKGRIPSIADQELKYQTYYDPAIYQYGVPSEVSVDETIPWTDEHVGELWWDLSKVKFTWYEQGDSTFRNANWGRLFTGCTIDIYEWVETTYLPSKWAEIADTETGIALGISGIPKDIDNFTWSSKFKYDPVSGSKTTLYYYWVKNKTIVPNIGTRKLSCADVSRLILDPKSQGYRFVSITDQNTMSVSNIGNKLVDSDISLNLQFYQVDNTELLTHREYVLIANNDPNAIIPRSIENKWFDSLVGSNITGQRLPDTRLNKKQRYGNLNSPRQTWFINRFEALKQLFEYVNSVLAKQIIVDDINFSNLKKSDLAPTLNSGEIDQIIDVIYELKFVGTAKVRTAKLSVDVVDGSFKTIRIIDKGYGYGRNKVYSEDNEGNPTSWFGPVVNIIGAGTGAAIQTVIDSEGQIIDVPIIKSGIRYDNNTKLSVRNYTVLINNDEEANNAWSIHTWNSSRQEWNRTHTQSYDVSRYWKYKDWYATGYGLSSDIGYQLERTVDLNGLPINIGDIVKINNVGYGNWLLLERVDNTYGSDFTTDYKVVGRQNGTIEFSDKLYNLNKTLGFDTNFSFDLSFYDQSSTTELRIILETLRDYILINDLRLEYVRTFFNSVYYVLSEQLYTDWCFKTSFLKANHNVGTLKQRITFQGDEVDSYESFIEEAKPYKTKIREWVSSYQALEETEYVVTDFDLPSYYNVDPKSEKIERTTSISDNINKYPWKSWLDHHTYQITDIILTDGGTNYTTTPVVIITGDGTGAKASAYIANGSVYKIVVDDPGKGYKSKPIVLISGGNGDIRNTGGTPAKAYAQIGNSLVRTNFIGMKFDRYTNSYFVDDFNHTDRFNGTGSKKTFKLSFAPEIEKNKFKIIVDDIEYYGSQYDVSIKEVFHNTYTALEGYVTFNQVPDLGSLIEITYDKNIKLYSAADRINYAYNPKAGQYGKDLAQLMTGIDYSGVTLTSIDFEIGGGWDVLSWDVTSWDNVLSSNDDYVVRSNGITRSFTLPYIPEAGEVINTYLENTYFYDTFVTTDLENPITIPVKNSYDAQLGDEVAITGIGVVGRVSSIDSNNITLNQQVMEGVILKNTIIRFSRLVTNRLDGDVMSSLIGNGINNVIEIPDTVDLEEGNLLTFRKSTSDGSILPSDRSLVDSLVSGGSFLYSSALGTSPEDIIVDGDTFISADTSHGPEELVQGQVFDTVDIKVYHTPSSGGPSIYINNYSGDSRTKEFSISQLPGTLDGIIVLVDNILVDFTINYMDKTVVFDVIPINNSKIVIIIFDTSGYDILDKVSFIGDATTNEFLTSARYTKDDISVFVTVNGVAKGATVKSSNSRNENKGTVIVQLDSPPAVDSVIQIMVFSGTIQKYSKITNEIIPIEGGKTSYTLNSIPLENSPASANVFVVVDGYYLASPDYKNFIYQSKSLVIDDLTYLPNTLNQSDINVYKNRKQLASIQDYTVDSSNNSVILSPGVAINGDEIIIEILKKTDYQIIDDKIKFTNNFDISNKQTIKVTSFTNHDILKVKKFSKGFTFATGYDVGGYQTTTYDLLSTSYNTSGIFNLPRIVSNNSGVFVVLNHKFLAQNVDFIVLDNRKQIKVLLPDRLIGNDYIEIITTNEQTVHPSFGFKIFKDMLNRTSYKVLDKTRITTLAQDLNISDTRIVVTDGSILTTVINNQTSGTRIPGIIEINGERIEYFKQDGNTLSQLRRATLGTSISQFVPAGTSVSDAGTKLTIPYTDKEIKRTSYGDGTKQVFDVDFVPLVTSSTTATKNKWYRDTIPSTFGQCDTIEVYVAGRRLLKNPMYVYDKNLGQDSYNGAGDKQIEAEFSVDGVSKSVRLTTPPNAGELVLIIAKQGRIWQKPNENLSLVYSNSDIARFLNTKQVDLPK